MLYPLEKPNRDIDFATGGDAGIQKAEEAIDKMASDLLKAMKNLLVRFNTRKTELKKEGISPKHLIVNYTTDHAKQWEDCLRKYSESMWKVKELNRDWKDLAETFVKMRAADKEFRDKFGTP